MNCDFLWNNIVTYIKHSLGCVKSCLHICMFEALSMNCDFLWNNIVTYIKHSVLGGILF